MIALSHQPAGCEFVSDDDQQINDAAIAALSSSKYGPLRKLRCRVSQGVVEIFGSVPSFYLKALAQAAVLQLSPSTTVRNFVEVSDENSLFVATHCGSEANSAS